MNKYTFSGGLLFVFAIVVGIGLLTRRDAMAQGCTIRTIEDVEKLFSYDPVEITRRFAGVKEHIAEQVAEILAVPNEKRTFDNTFMPLDNLLRYVTTNISPLFDQSYVNPSKNIRDLVQVEYLGLDAFMQDHLNKNVKLYEACKAYSDFKKEQSSLNPEFQRFVTETMKKFKRNGLGLPADKLKELKDVTNQINALEIEFDKNIAEDDRTIEVTRAELKGLSDNFIDALKKGEDGRYVLGKDYPTFSAVMKQCEVESTRKKMYVLFNNKAYPVNVAVLNKVIALRDKLAHLLGFNSYAEYELDDQMIKTTTRAYDFIRTLMDQAKSKQKQEFEELTKELPDSVSLSENGKLKPWDIPYLKEEYKKKHFSIDDEKVAEYFPVDNTLKEVFNIYQTLLGLKFEPVTMRGLWDPEVRVIKIISTRDESVLGYLLLDLYPRQGKYTHACHDSLVLAQRLPDGTVCPALSIVIANFPKPQNGKPGLLKYDDVKTFFHEFGHAMHGFLGATQIGAFAGTNVKRDFVETPSQMFEEWLDDKEMLQTIGKHYETGEPLPAPIIEKLVGLLKFDSGDFVASQGVYSLLALDLFAPGADKDPQQLVEKLAKAASPYKEWSPDNHHVVSFGHLMGYGARYYGYLWSRVFAIDLFDQIKKEGLLSPQAGEKLTQNILGAGGSQDPDVLLKNYLGREPSQDAFLKYYGLN